MKYLKITADNYNDAMKKLRMEHGDEAIPISHKYVKQGGFFNSKVFAKEVVELTAAVKEKKSFSPQGQKKSTIDFLVDDKKEPTKLGKVQEILDRATAMKDDFSVDSINRSIDTLNDSLNSLKKPAETGYACADDTKEIITEYVPLANQNGSESGLTRNIEREVNDIKTALNRLLEAQKNNFHPVPADEEITLTPFREMLRANDFDYEECDIIIKM